MPDDLTGVGPDEALVCDRSDFPVVRKPFLMADVVRLPPAARSAGA